MLGAVLLVGGGGCTAALLPGEVVIPGDVPMEVSYGTPGSEYGSTVAWKEGLLVVTAPTAGTLTVGEGSTRVGALWADFWGPHLVYAAANGSGYVDGEERWSVPDALAWAAGDAGVVATDGDRLYLLDRDRSVRAPGISALAIGTDRVLGVQCNPDCAGVAWTMDGEPLGVFAEAGAGGAVGEWDGVAWAGAPDLDVADGRGRAVAEDGREIPGQVGDHLGIAIGGGYVAGEFNKWTVPALERIVALDGHRTYALDQGAEAQPVSLAGDGELLVLGAPFYPHGTAPSGLVAVVAAR